MKLKCGDEVMWKGCFGMDNPQKAKITNIQLCEAPHMKYGEEVQEVDWADVPRCVVSLDNNHWAYGNQIAPLN